MRLDARIGPQRDRHTNLHGMLEHLLHLSGSRARLRGDRWRIFIGVTANPATDLSPDTVRDTVAEMVARIVGPR